MAMDGSVEFEWGDGPHKFRLGLDEARELQIKTGVGLYRLMKRIAEGDWMIDDLRETIRIGMIGGGADPMAAMNLVRTYFDKQPKTKNIEPALRILHAFHIGAEDEPIGTTGNSAGKPEAKETKTQAASPSPASTH